MEGIIDWILGGQRVGSKHVVAIVWLLVLVAAVYVRLRQPELLGNGLRQVREVSPALAGAVFLLVGSLRGFTLIPSTYLVAVGLLLFPPWPLFLLAMGGIMVSSLCVYYFAGYMQLGALLERRHAAQLDRVRRALVRSELPVIVAWSALPMLPTDLICYLAATLRVDVRRLMLGVTLGESLTVGTYVFLGHHLLERLSALVGVTS